MPKVSVVIPTYNYAHFVGEAIQSILNQSFRDFEIIVIDDGSTDNTAEVVSAFPVRYYYQENQGLAAARNSGIKLTQGEYINFLDADDLLTEDTLEKGVEVLDSHPEVGFSYGQALLFDDKRGFDGVIKSSFLHSSTIVDGKEQIRELALFSNRITISSVLARRSCIEEAGGFNVEMRRFQDHHFCIQMAKKFPVAYIAEPLVKYRVHPEALHKNVDPYLAERVFLLIAEEIFNDPDTASYFQPWKDQVYSHYYQKIASYAYGRDMKLARRYLRRAVKTHPQMMLTGTGISMAYLYAKTFLPTKPRIFLYILKRRFSTPKRLMGGKSCPQ